MWPRPSSTGGWTIVCFDRSPSRARLQAVCIENMLASVRRGMPDVGAQATVPPQKAELFCDTNKNRPFLQHAFNLKIYTLLAFIQNMIY